MKNKHWTLIGASYAIFALTIATMATYQESDTLVANQPTVVAQATEGPVWRGKRLDLDDTRSERSRYWITIWTTRNCTACERQKALVPEMEAAGYHIVVRQVPGQRWIKSFPASLSQKTSQVETSSIPSMDSKPLQRLTRFSRYERLRRRKT